MKCAFFAALIIPNAMRIGGTGRRNTHCFMTAGSEYQSPENFVCLNMEKMKNRVIFYMAAIWLAHRVNFYEV
jgi:hypothetical protein